MRHQTLLRPMTRLSADSTGMADGFLCSQACSWSGAQFAWSMRCPKPVTIHTAIFFILLLMPLVVGAEYDWVGNSVFHPRNNFCVAASGGCHLSTTGASVIGCSRPLPAHLARCGIPSTMQISI